MFVARWWMVDRTSRIAFRTSRCHLLLVPGQLTKKVSFEHCLHNCVFTAINHNYDHKQRTLKHRNTQNRSKSTNHKSQTTTFWNHWRNRFLRGPLRWLMAARNANVSSLLNFRIRMFWKSAVQAKTCLRINWLPWIMVQFCYLRPDIKTVSCYLLLLIKRMNMNRNWKSCKCNACKNHHKNHYG